MTTCVPPSTEMSPFKAEGKHVTISGPSGSGKTTLVQKMFRHIGVSEEDVLSINGRTYSTSDSSFHIFATELSTQANFKSVTEKFKKYKFIFLDDFHHLSAGARTEIAKHLKLWFENKIRFIIVGISSSASDLVGEDGELGIRNDPFEVRTQSEDFVHALLRQGEQALNFQFSEDLRKEIVIASNGVPSVVHVICRNICIESSIKSTLETVKVVDLKLKDLTENILRVFKAKYFSKLVGLAKGKQQAKSVHNTYFDIVEKITKDKRSDIPTEYLYSEIVGKIPDAKERSRKATSYYNCLNNLSDVIEEKGLKEILHYKDGSAVVSIEDPSFRFYLNLIDINEVKKQVHIRKSTYPYDVALSFAGTDRTYVIGIVNELKKLGVTPFYDFDQQALLWGKNLRSKLAEVYANDAKYMLVFLSKDYPEKDWTQFELEIGKEAAGKRSTEYLLPVLIDDTAIVGISKNIGYIDSRTTTPQDLAKLLEEKLNSDDSERK